MSVLISAICIFILLCLSAFLAFAVPLNTQSNTSNNIDENVEIDSVLGKLVKTSKDVPPVIQYLN